MKKTVKDVDVSGKKVLVRVDFNVPLKNGAVADNTRIRASLPTIRHLIEQNARVILCSHLGRPKGAVVESLRLDPVARELSELLGEKVRKVDDCIGPEVEKAVDDLEPGGVLLLENTRFHPQEKENDAQFAAKLAEPAQVYVNDAFAAAHRAHASTEGVAHHLPAVAGLLMQRELDTLEKTLSRPSKPFGAILGGAKISDKIGVIENLLARVDVLLVGGGMANTFLKARGLEVGLSLVESDSLQQAGDLLEKAGDKLVLPTDAVIADSAEADGDHHAAAVEQIPSDWRIMDVGPETVRLFQDKLQSAKTVVWNGPLGVAEQPPFSRGTEQIARELAKLDAVTVIGGGDSVAAVRKTGQADRMTHLSTGGGAFLDFLEGRELPGVSALEDR